jgi:predicted nucleic acid-binding protein
MTDRAFLDTNILVYALVQRADATTDRRTETAENLLLAGGVVSVQVLTEFADVVSRKHGKSWQIVAEMLEGIEVLCGPAIPLTSETHKSALAVSKRYSFRIHDSLILAAAAQAGCATVYTEDLQHGQTIESVKIINPFL